MSLFRTPGSALPTVIAIGVLLAACGGTADDGSQASGGYQSATEPAGAPTAPVTIAMKDVKFLPDRVTVKVGETVTWRNDEALDHNVVAQKGGKFKSRAFGQGGTYTFTPRRAGTIDYVCTLHPGMEGRLVVTG